MRIIVRKTGLLLLLLCGNAAGDDIRPAELELTMRSRFPGIRSAIYSSDTDYRKAFGVSWIEQPSGNVAASFTYMNLSGDVFYLQTNPVAHQWLATFTPPPSVDPLLRTSGAVRGRLRLLLSRIDGVLDAAPGSKIVALIGRAGDPLHTPYVVVAWNEEARDGAVHYSTSSTVAALRASKGAVLTDFEVLSLFASDVSLVACGPRATAAWSAGGLSIVFPTGMEAALSPHLNATCVVGRVHQFKSAYATQRFNAAKVARVANGSFDPLALIENIAFPPKKVYRPRQDPFVWLLK